MKFSNIPQLIPDGGYEVNMPLDSLDEKLNKWETNPNFLLNLNPDFQRGHVWNDKQRRAYVEYFLQGGRSGMVVYFNKPSWANSASTSYDDFVIVDGLQRLTALRLFMTNKLRVYGCLYREFDQTIEQCRNADSLRFNINSLQTRAQVLNWYYQMNSGGTPHSAKELARVKALLDAETTR